MSRYTCYIIDDEPLAIKVIERFIEHFSEIKILGTFTDSFSAFQRFNQSPSDLIFLDVQMPELTGLEFIRSLRSRPDIIITTAYRDFAVEGFEMRVLDYLVKPIEVGRFAQAMELFLRKKQAMDSSHTITVRADRKQIIIHLDEILYVEGVKDYIKIVLKEGQVLTKETLGSFYVRLPELSFLRVHKSYIISVEKVTAFNHHYVEIGKDEIPIGRVYKDETLKRLEV